MQTTFSVSEIIVIKFIKDKMKKDVRLAIEKTFNIYMVDFLFNNTILTGGATASIFHGADPSDWDLYFKEQATIDSIFDGWIKNPDNAQYIQDVDEQYLGRLDGGTDGKMITARAVTFKNKIQVITMQTADKRTQFDMIHCMPWYDMKNDVIHISRAQYDSIRDKKIVPNPHINAFPISSYRMEKYKNRGWT
jgi:hypothetical protein